VTRLLSVELLGEADQSLIAFRQGFGKGADLLLKLIGALHVAWTVVAANADKYATPRRGELDANGFESLLGSRLRFFRDRALSPRQVQLGSR
jgi:hypothetical protein